MDILIGHGNMDLDCIGSLVLAKYLFPGYVPFRSGLIHPVARNVYNLYKDRLGFLDPSELKGQKIGHVVVVDTRAADKVEEFFRYFDPASCRIDVYDHHPKDGREIPGAVVHECRFGSNTAFLCLEMMRRGLLPDAEDATIALTGIYADTGNFLHENVCREDFEAASYLLERGAVLTLVKEFLVSLREAYQVTLFHEVLNSLSTRSIRGHKVHACYMETEDETQGIGAVVEKVFEVENCGLLFGFFYFKRKKKLLVIARNNSAEVNLNEILSGFGGGGHGRAASATVKTEDGRGLAEGILGFLDRALAPAATAEDIMSKDVRSLDPEKTLLDASLFLEETNHTGAPVIDDKGRVIGMLTLRDIMKGRKAGQMKGKVRQFMAKNVVTIPADTTVQDIDQVLFAKAIGHLPVIRNGELVGIVTRTDFLRHMRGERLLRDKSLKDMGFGPPAGAESDWNAEPANSL